MATLKGRVTMTEAYAKRLLEENPDWAIIDGVLCTPEDILEMEGK
jgi:hypothetical protein